MNHHHHNNLRTFKKLNVDDTNELKKYKDQVKNAMSNKKTYSNSQTQQRFSHTTNNFYTPNSEVIKYLLKFRSK